MARCFRTPIPMGGGETDHVLRVRSRSHRRRGEGSRHRSREFSALYTNAMLDALTGARPDLLEPGDTPTDAFRYVRPESSDYLTTDWRSGSGRWDCLAMSIRSPDAIIVLAKQLAGPAAAAPGPGRARPKSPQLAAHARHCAPHWELSAESASVVGKWGRNVVGRRRWRRFPPSSIGLGTAPAPGAADLVVTAERIAEPFGPDIRNRMWHQGSRCPHGRRVRDARRPGRRSCRTAGCSGRQPSTARRPACW